MVRCFTVLLVSLLLASCVTEELGSRANRDKDPDKELADNIRLAKAYIQEGYTARAIDPLTRALEIDSDSAEAYSVLALVYQIEGDVENARDHFEKAVALNPEASDIQHNFGYFLYSQKDYEEAIPHLLQAGQNIRYTRRSLSFELAGLCELRMNHQDKAEEYFLRALRLERGLPGASLELADMYYQQSQNNKALVNYERFLDYSDQNARSLLLGIRLAKVFSNRDREASFALQLNQFYPGSPELKQYEEMKKL